MTLAATVRLKAQIASEDDKEWLSGALFYLRQPSTGSVDGDIMKLASLIEEYVELFVSVLACVDAVVFRLVVGLGLKSDLDQYKVPREDVPKIAEKALGGQTEIFGDVVELLNGLYP